MFKIKQKNLILITAILWMGVSFMLTKKAIGWIELFNDKLLIILILVSIAVSLLKFFLIFKRVTKKNIKRIMNLQGEKVFILAFHSWKTYILILIMIGGGVTLRHLEFVPKSALFPIYIGVGVAMFISSLMYYHFFFKNYQRKNEFYGK